MTRGRALIALGGIVGVAVAVFVVLGVVERDNSPAGDTEPPPPMRIGKEVDPKELREITRDNPFQPTLDDAGNVVVPVEPGEIYTRLDPLLSSDIMSPITSAWKAGNHYDLVVVQAGASATDKSLGLLVIWRTSTRDVAGPTTDLVEVPGGGTLRITNAPVGRSVVKWATERGELEFEGSRGVRGTLSLTDDSVALDRTA